MNLKVSILVPVFKVEAHIEKCAVSLFCQTFESIQFIFVNDCTPDCSIEILEKTLLRYPLRKNQVKIINHKQNLGIGATRNSLLKAASGEYILWVDGDDYISADAVEKLIEVAESSDADLITSDSYFFYKGEGKTEIFKQNFPKESKHYIEALARHQVRAALWGTLSKRSLWVDNKIEIQGTSRFGEDYFATVQLFYFASKIKCVQLPFYFYNQTNLNAYTKGYKSENHFISTIQLFDNLSTFFKNKNTSEQYNSFLSIARITEFSGLLLHTTSELRRKYGNSIEVSDLSGYYKLAGLTCWQFVILKQIVSGNNLIADILIVIAKILRVLFGINF